jgi:RNA polymerase sigma-70 factor (sigma-E family)
MDGPAEAQVSRDKIPHDNEAVTRLYDAHYRSFVRLASLLVRDEQTAEEVVQDCFIALHDGWHRLRDEDKALAYLKQAVVNRSGSVLRHRGVVDRNAAQSAPQLAGTEPELLAQLGPSAVIATLRGLTDRQRQVLVLRYYADLSEAQIASVMGISKGAVRTHAARGMSLLRAVLEENT